MDLVGPLPITSNSNRYILSIQDHLSRLVILAPLKHQTAKSVADALINKLVTIFGSPKTIVTDRGSQFCSTLIKAIAKWFKIKKIETTDFSLWQNLVDRMHHPLCTYLRNFSGKKREWDQILDLAQFHYDCNIHEAHNYKPYELVFGFPPRYSSDEPLKKSGQLQTISNYLQNLIENLNEVSEIARENIIASKEKSKNFYDRYLNKESFEVGDMVWMVREPLKGKLEKVHNIGPFEVLKVERECFIVINYKRKFKIVHANKLFVC